MALSEHAINVFLDVENVQDLLYMVTLKSTSSSPNAGASHWSWPVTVDFHLTEQSWLNVLNVLFKDNRYVIVEIKQN